MNINIKLVLLILTLGCVLVWFIFIKESSKDIIQGTIIDIERGILDYDNKQYKATWGEEKTYSGYVRYVGQAKNKYVPFMTNEVILTTGDFSDPSLVTIGPVRNHSTFWTAQKQPKGELYFIHCIPLDLSVLLALEGIKQGQWVELTGKQATDNAIYGPGDVLYWQTLKASHPTFLVTDVYYSEEVSN